MMPSTETLIEEISIDIGCLPSAVCSAPGE